VPHFSLKNVNIFKNIAFKNVRNGELHHNPSSTSHTLTHPTLELNFTHSRTQKPQTTRNWNEEAAMRVTKQRV
jgi:hypothetical protein